MLERAEIEFEVDLLSYQAALTPALEYYGVAAVAQTLANEDVCRATPLFRFCFGVLYGLPAICSRYFQAAQYQYNKNQQAYDRIWDGQLLNGLRTNHG